MITLFVLQATTRCNLNCKYCYLPEDSRRKFDLMPASVLSRAAGLVLRSSLVPPSLTVLWHAGEPLAAGLPFFENALEIIKKNNVHARSLGHSIQTNGTLINQKWCEFLKKNAFEIGLSIDGPEFLHNDKRIGWNGRGSFASVMKGLECLRRNELKYRAICVLTQASLDYPDEIFDFFVDHGFSSIAFNVEEIEAANTVSTLLNDSCFGDIQKRYIAFMERMLERWIISEGKVHIREFDSLCRKILSKKMFADYAPMLDVSQGLQIVTVRIDGSIVTFSPELASGTKTDPDAFVVGHIDDLSELEDIFASTRYLALRREIKSGIAKCKSECGYFGVCGGGWPSNKYAENGTFDCTETRNCVLHTKTLADVVIKRFTERKEFAEAVAPYIAQDSMPRCRVEAPLSD